MLKSKLIDFVGSDIHSKNHIMAFDKKIKIKNRNLLQHYIDRNIEVFSD